MRYAFSFAVLAVCVASCAEIAPRTSSELSYMQSPGCGSNGQGWKIRSAEATVLAHYTGAEIRLRYMDAEQTRGVADAVAVYARDLTAAGHAVGRVVRRRIDGSSREVAYARVSPKPDDKSGGMVVGRVAAVRLDCDPAWIVLAVGVWRPRDDDRMIMEFGHLLVTGELLAFR